MTKKQQWYQQNQVSMLKDDEEDYVAYCTEAMFKIHILELRLQVSLDDIHSLYKLISLSY